MPLISVIVNLYNGRATLAEAMDSVLAQTYSDWELLIWDDCSSDGSVEVARGYDDARIRYYRSDAQLALGQARQAAIDMAQGEWIAFLDQDDVWLPRKLEQQLALARERPEAALIYGRTVRFYPSGTERDYDQAHEYAPLPEGDIFGSLFGESCYIAMSSAMFRRSALPAVGGIPESIRIIPDYYLYTAVARRFPAVAVQEVVCRYRMHGTSTSQRSAIAVQEEALRMMDMWRGVVSTEALAKCRRHHSTQMALAEMCAPATFMQGLWRLMSQGSLWSQVVRPFWFVFHLARRTVVPPYWKRGGGPRAH
ncbi:MAG TPA: glycosyltransferase [Candidatus Angelobacter sp.]|jgi:glycosyltransferase involved in cell wall biosynthesis|nr:glycosyltransferase [Candidatus Angelobacter sp.]